MSMKIRRDEHFIVTTNEGQRHPVGTEVVVIHINPSATDSKPILARAREGRTEYWYAAEELDKEVDGIRL